MRNLKLVLRYDGSRYSGWQSQKHDENTIQGRLTVLLERLLGETIELAGSNSPVHNVFERKYVYALEEALDEETMRQAAANLCGTHDFRAFSSYRRTKKSTIRTLENITIERQGSELILTFTGDGFLYHMVRILTGTLIEVGLHKKKAGEIKEILASQDRERAGFTAPAQGLCLVCVEYGN